MKDLSAKEIIVDGKTGFLFPSMEASGFAELLGRLVDSDDLRIETGATGQAHVFNEFTVEKARSHGHVVGKIYSRLRGVRRLAAQRSRGQRQVLVAPRVL